MKILLMIIKRNTKLITMKIFQEGGYIVKYVLNVNKEECAARKKMERAKRKRNQRKTPYPFGFEYRSERK
jgi:hypothetical protein